MGRLFDEMMEVNKGDKIIKDLIDSIKEVTVRIKMFVLEGA